MLPEGKCRYIDGQIYPDGNFYVLDTEHIKHNGNELKSSLNDINVDVSNKVDKEPGKGLSTEDYTTGEKNKLSGIEANANNYVHPTTSGNKHIPSGGSSGKILGWASDGTAAWVDPSGGGSGTVETVFIGSTEYAPDANGKVTLPSYPTTLPASDVYAWAKASSKPSYNQDEIGDGSTYKRVSATEKSTWNAKGTYSKPSGGIPKTDLASAVQTSLSKADSALQSFTETDPTVPSWAKQSSKPSYTASEVGAIATSAKGVASGVAELDASGKVPSSQLPSYVDDVLEYSAKSSFPSTGETGKIYVDTSENKTYRWSGSTYTEISPSLALGETSSTAYRGDRGKTAYNHSQLTSGNPHNVTKSDVGLGNVGNFKAVSTVSSQGLSDTEKSNARANIGAGTSSFSGSYNDLSNKPTIPTKTSQLTNDSGYTTNTGTVTGVKVGSTSYSPSSGIVSLPAYPTSLPASDVYSWAKASSKPSYTYSEVGAAPASHTHYQISTIGDYRSVATKPNDYPNLAQFKGLKQNSVIGNPSSDTYSYILGLRGWSDNSGGNAHEFAFNDTGIFTRRGASTSWGSWTKLAMTSDIPSSLPASDVYSWAKQSSKPSYTQDEVGDGTTYKRVTSTEKSTWNNKGTYSKPSGGIPKSDLASAVQTSLGKADSALQSITAANITDALGYTPANNDGVNQALNTRVVSATYGYVQSSTSTIRVYKSADRGVILAVYGSQGGTNKQSSILVFDVQQGILSVRRLMMGGNSEVVDGVTINEYSQYHEAVVTLTVPNSSWPPVIIPLMRADSVPRIEVF